MNAFLKKIFNIIFGIFSKNINVNISSTIDNKHYKSMVSRDGLTILKALLSNDNLKKYTEKEAIILNNIKSLVASHESKIGDGTTFLSLFLLNIAERYNLAVNKEQFCDEMIRELLSLKDFLVNYKIKDDKKLLERYINTTLKKDKIAQTFIDFLNSEGIALENLKDINFSIKSCELTTTKDKEITIKKSEGNMLNCYIPNAFRAQSFKVLENVNISLYNDFLTVDAYERLAKELLKNQVGQTLLFCNEVDTQLYNHLYQKALTTGLEAVLIPVTTELPFKKLVRAFQIFGLYDDKLEPQFALNESGLKISKCKKAILDVEKGNKIFFDFILSTEDHKRIATEYKALTETSNKKLDITPDELSDIATLRLFYSNNCSELSVFVNTNNYARQENIKLLLEDLFKGLKQVEDKSSFIDGRLLSLLSYKHSKTSKLEPIIDEMACSFYRVSCSSAIDNKSNSIKSNTFIVNPVDLRQSYINCMSSAVSLLEGLRDCDMDIIIETDMEAVS